MTTELDGRFTESEINQFWENGFAVVRGLAPERLCDRMLAVTRYGLEQEVAPVEYEADLGYPGAPSDRQAAGGRTIRRLKQAFTRDYVFTEWMLQPGVIGRLRQLLGPTVYCPLAHHNCIMTKQPQYSSATRWHQDIRYWSFHTQQLVNVWLALGDETPANGCLQVIPGSHRITPRAEQLDRELFFREDLPENEQWIAKRQYVSLKAGDVLFFHARTLHAADRNSTGQTKYSVVFTFRGAENPPIPESRSASCPELLIPPPASPTPTAG